MQRALVGTQLGQTLLVGRTSTGVVAASMGSAALLAAVIQTPGRQPVLRLHTTGPIGWVIAAIGATAATLGATALPPIVERLTVHRDTHR